MWCVKTEEEANKPDEPIDLVGGMYEFKIYGTEIKTTQFGSDYGILKQIVSVHGGKVFAEDAFFDSKKGFFKRQEFWKSVGFPERVNDDIDSCLDKIGKAFYDVETYYSKKHGEHRKKLVVVNYVTSDNVLPENDIYTKDNYTKDNSPSLEDYPAIEDDSIPF